jgi:hypothetical protein
MIAKRGRRTQALWVFVSLMSAASAVQAESVVLPAPAGRVDRADPAPQGSAWRLAVQTEAAVGITPGPFYNHLAGGRADYRFTDATSAGIYVGYANLKAPDDGRAHNVLSYLMLDYRVSLSSDWSIPLRVASGYLPKNGPVLRLAAGFSHRLSDELELTLELFTPTLWVVDDKTVLSFDAALEGAYLVD